MANTVLEVKQLCKTFAQRTVVDHVSFQVHAGQTIGLLGPNGAGKSTTVNMICGLLKADHGEVLLAGESMFATNNKAKSLLGLVPQDLALIDDISARENLKLFGALYGLSGGILQERCDIVLDLVGLTERAKDKPASFSGGMKRRLNIAAALIHDPQLLILDEPTVGIDPQSRNAIFETLEILKSQGRALIYTSHYMEEVERLADHIVIMDHGKVIANQTPTELLRRLPAQAALHVCLLQPISPFVLEQLKQQMGVTELVLADANNALEIALQTQESALPVLNFLRQVAGEITHFSTAKSKLEDVFLNLTGRSLRD